MFKSILSSIKTIITDNDQSKIKKAKKNLISEVTTFVDTLSTELKEGTKVVQEGAKEVYHEAKREFAKQEVTREVMKTINEYPTQTMQWIINTVYGHFELNSKRKYPKAYVHSIVQSIMKEEPKWNVETIVNEISKIKERFPFVDVETLTTVV